MKSSLAAVGLLSLAVGGLAACGDDPAAVRNVWTASSTDGEHRVKESPDSRPSVLGPE